MKPRAGSALLVVLGMLSFMVISGLAFAVFMRTTRLSSSFTRRTVTTRQLAKAALAEAIDQIDRAVANDPHPGVRNPYRSYLATLPTGSSKNGSSATSDFNPLKIDNVWSHRVLVGQVGSLDNLDCGVKVQIGSTTYYPEFVDPEDTVSVLALEALAYLPPSLINEVRYYGQRTPTANWQSLDFDAGRFAYVAVDVSDFFDVNRIFPNVPRSSDPATRVTLGHVFEQDVNHMTSGNDASEWETFVGNYRSVGLDGSLSFGSTPPLVSLADFNLALGAAGDIGGLRSPFYVYFNGDGSSAKGFYKDSPGGSSYERYAQMNFVTDSLMALRPERELKLDDDYVKEVWDLSDDANQIFPETFIESGQENRTLLSVGQQMASSAGNRLTQQRIPYVTMFALNDYLDCDRIPITLGMPSVERVPMICGIKPVLGSGKLKVETWVNSDNKTADQEVQGSKANKDPTVRVRRTVAWRVNAQELANLFAGGQLQVLVAYPFRNHEQKDEHDWFKVDGKIQLFLSSGQMRLRTGNKSDLLHWGASGNASNGGTAGLKGNAVLNLPLTAENITLTTVPIADQKESQLGSKCVYKPDDHFALTPLVSEVQTALKDDKGDLISVTYEWDETYDEQSDSYSPDYAGSLPPASQITAASSALWPLKADYGDSSSVGTVDGDFKNVTVQTVSTLSKTLYLNMAVTLRVISDNAGIRGESASGLKTVDMVPATIFDDNDVNGINNDNFGAAIYQDISGEPTPLMQFVDGVSFDLKLDMAAVCDQSVALSASAVMVNDPRYNHAPENWVAKDFSSPQDWYENLAKASAQANDGDIFMASSDQDYLQSPYEFAFLPRCSDLVQYGNGIRGNLSGYPSAANSWVRLCPNGTTPPDAGVMWRTYDPFGRYSTAGDDFDGLGLDFGEGRLSKGGGPWSQARGLRVNPYSNFNSVLMAAFANTPHDWRVASDNEDENPAGVTAMKATALFDVDHAWNQFSGNAKLSWASLEDVADQFYDRIRDGFSHPNNLIYKEDSDYCIKSVDDDYAPIWQDAFARFFGSAVGQNTTKTLCNVTLDGTCSEVFSVDKKFLYGYWKSCFAARQQLYLVFFRAEPMMLGGGVAGATPPQLGAKGVALVWRDPYDPNERKNTVPDSTVKRYYPDASGNDQYVPHRTRVLFYKQFE